MEEWYAVQRPGGGKFYLYLTGPEDRRLIFAAWPEGGDPRLVESVGVLLEQEAAGADPVPCARGEVPDGVQTDVDLAVMREGAAGLPDLRAGGRKDQRAFPWM